MLVLGLSVLDMRHRGTILSLVASTVLGTGAWAQSVTTPPQRPPEDRSFYEGRPVVHPEALSGIWEAPDGRGGAVGIHLELTTTLSGDADPPRWTPQAWENLGVAVFDRSGPDLDHGEENSFSDSSRGGGLRFENGRLTLHFVSRRHEPDAVDLDLELQSDGCWHGRFHRNEFDTAVALCRPAPPAEVTPSPLIGTWDDRSGTRCVHMAQTGRGTFTAWSDSLMVPGRMVFAPNVPGPHLLYERYGSRTKVEAEGNGSVALVFGAYSGICCSQEFNGSLSADGRRLEGSYAPGPNQTPVQESFTKMPGGSCVDPGALHRVTLAPCPPAVK